MWLASVTGLVTPLPSVRLDVVAADGVSQARVSELRIWLQSALEKEGVTFTSPDSRAVSDGGTARLLVLELREGQWRVWTAEAPNEAVAIDASDFAVASLEALHQASLLLAPKQEPGASAESADFAAGAPVGGAPAQTPRAAPVARTHLPQDVGLSDADIAAHARALWLDVNVGIVVSERANFVLGLGGARFLTENWGAAVDLAVHHVSDFTSFDDSWNLSIWDYRVSAGPMFSVALSERLRFNTGLRVGLTIHTYDFTDEAWGVRVNALANAPLAFSYQSNDWRCGLTGNVAFNSATFTHRVFGEQVWETEQLNAGLMASLGRRLW